jgi:ubiquinone/menaquinone biosynthesis C-methylase UbiE
MKAHYAKDLIGKIVLFKRRKCQTQLENAFFRDLLHDLMSNPSTRKRVEYILTFNSDNPIFKEVLTKHERALPGDQEFQNNGWYEVMLTRYALGAHYSKAKCVLDTCSGLGWGSYLLDSVAKRVIALDVDGPAVKLASSLWPSQRTEYVQGSVLNLSLVSNCIDIALAMESIEHFELSHVKRYLDELYRVLKRGGMLIGSSSFPETREQAMALCARNPYHLHIFTRAEFDKLLIDLFSKHYIYQNGLFFWAVK